MAFLDEIRDRLDAIRAEASGRRRPFSPRPRPVA
jgi:hypothetical protein